MSGFCFISKLVEQAVAFQASDHIISNALDNVSQPNKLCHFRGEATAGVLPDQLAAFDTVDHSALFYCLSSGVVLDWFSSYMTDCSQCINIGFIVSEA